MSCSFSDVALVEKRVGFFSPASRTLKVWEIDEAILLDEEVLFSKNKKKSKKKKKGS